MGIEDKEEIQKPTKQYFRKEPMIHSHITDCLPDTHPLAGEFVYCDNCRKKGKFEMLHASNNECMQTWFETEFGNFCINCFKLNEVLEDLDECIQ